MSDEQHCNLKIPLTLEDLRVVWSDASEKVRMEILKSVIWTAPDMHDFHTKTVKVLTSIKFMRTLD